MWSAARAFVTAENEPMLSSVADFVINELHGNQKMETILELVKQLIKYMFKKEVLLCHSENDYILGLETA